MKKKIFWSILLLIGIASCTNPKGAEKALRDAGYHPISVGGYAWFMCGQDDLFATKFRAYSNDSSRIVTGCVCEGFFKGKTIRLN